MRTLFIIIALALIVMVIKRLWQAPRPSDRSGRSGKPSGNTVQCANCGVYIPVEEALRREDHFYCSQAHLDEDMRNKT